MSKIISVISVAWGICKRFDGEEIKEIVSKVKEIAGEFKQMKEDGINAEEGIEIVKSAVELYDVIKDAYSD